MGRMFLLTKPMGISIVRLVYLAGLVLLVAYVARDLAALFATGSDPLAAPPDLGLTMLRDVGVLLGGFVLLRLTAEVLVAQLDIRDKLGAIERNTQDARDKLGAVERNTVR